ncbi:phage portal protein [Lederbergia sp. NSJ-179]|uniref:phage portal protein n=1 Tax=Lederbergia sp. NSJ-179 TaxID=2931402 RepID=UPI001FD2C4E3|nr:phage portal protein [Lederbergia sp. NSJ-179]MCJ7839970.1 phage portal protein [Lederbergia sp. NSJ-179]
MDRYLISDNPQVVARALSKAIQEDKHSQAKDKARQGQAYYDYKHDILNNRIFYLDDNDVLQEDTFASNIKIPHPFFTELVDQKVQYLLSNPVEVEVEDEQFQEYLKEYYDEDLQLFLQEALEGASVKGFEYAYARTTAQDILKFQVSDSLQTFDVYDDNGDLKAVVRYYNKDITRDGKNTPVEHAEVWDDKQVTFYVKDKNGNFVLDQKREMNPRPHIVAIQDDGQVLERSYGTIPFYKLGNNKKNQTDLEPIKALIDDYDLMACFISNNLQDFTEAIYVVKGYPGDDLNKLRKNIKAKKTVGVSETGGLDIKTFNIPVDARKTKLEINKDAIYKFGMGFDSTQVGDGNITNIVIKSRYALLDMKANKAEIRLRSLLKWMNELIVQDINRRHGTAYKASDIKVTITRETMVNETDLVDRAKTEADTKQVIIQTILSVAPRLDDETVLKMICEQFELDWEEVQELLDSEDYEEGFSDNTDPVEEGDPDAGTGQVAEGA